MKDELKCEFELSTSGEPAMSVFDLPPPVFPARIVTVTFEPASSDHVHVVFGGNTKPFQRGFVEMKIKGQAYKERPEDQYGEYFRVISELDVGKTDECIAYLKEIVVDKCLCSSPVIVRKKTDAVRGPCIAGGARGYGYVAECADGGLSFHHCSFCGDRPCREPRSLCPLWAVALCGGRPVP